MAKNPYSALLRMAGNEYTADETITAISADLQYSGYPLNIANDLARAMVKEEMEKRSK